MRKLFSVRYNETAMDMALFLLRVTSGVSMAFYGYHKLIHYSEQVNSDFWQKELNFIGQSGAVSLGLTIFAEFFCSILLIAGLFTRLSLIPLLICMGYIVAIVDKYEIVSSGEHGFEMNRAFFYFMIFFALLLTGPGKWSLDKLISK